MNTTNIVEAIHTFIVIWPKELWFMKKETKHVQKKQVQKEYVWSTAALIRFLRAATDTYLLTMCETKERFVRKKQV